MNAAIRWFSEVGLADLPFVGGKNASLGIARDVRGLGRDLAHDLRAHVLEGVLQLDRAVEEPLRQIVANAGADASVVLNKVAEGKGNFGFNALTNRYGDLVEMGVVDPCKVTRSALQNTASIAGLALTTECMVAQYPEDKRAKDPREPTDIM